MAEMIDIQKIFWTEYIKLLSKKSVKQPQLIWDNSPNLSILMREGKETNKDFLSSGERKEISSALSHFVFMANMGCSVWNIYNLVWEISDLSPS